MRKFLQTLGLLLILASLGLLLGFRFCETRAQEESAAAADHLTEMLQIRTRGYTGEGPMPTLELMGRDYVCLLEIPGMNVTLPVCDDWDQRTRAGNPCRYWGSAYEDTLILGGGAMAQLDFCARLDLDDRVVVTDLQGREYIYEVKSILRRDDLTYEKLREGEYPLTIFTRDGSSSRSIVVHCGLPE